MKVLLYARVSTEAQTQKHSLDAQLNALWEFAKEMGFEVAGEYVDRGISGRSDEREAFLAMIRHATTPGASIGAILVHKLDRFSRNREDAIVYKALLKKHGVSVLSITEPVEDSPAGLLVEGILETIAEFYSRNLAQEVKKGQTEAAKKGQNQSEPPLGYRSVGGRLIVKPAEAEIVKFIFERYLQGISYRKIAGEVEAKFHKSLHPSTIAYILRNEAYIGIRIWNKRQKDGSIRPKSDWVAKEQSHTAIIEKDLFFKVQKLLKQRSKPKSKHLLSGLCQCMICNSPLHSQMQRGKVRLRCPEKLCPMGSVAEEKVAEAVFTDLELLLHHASPLGKPDLSGCNQEVRRLVLLSSIEKILIGRTALEIHYLSY